MLVVQYAAGIPCVFAVVLFCTRPALGTSRRLRCCYCPDSESVARKRRRQQRRNSVITDSEHWRLTQDMRTWTKRYKALVNVFRPEYFPWMLLVGACLNRILLRLCDRLV